MNANNKLTDLKPSSSIGNLSGKSQSSEGSVFAQPIQASCSSKTPIIGEYWRENADDRRELNSDLKWLRVLHITSKRNFSSIIEGGSCNAAEAIQRQVSSRITHPIHELYYLREFVCGAASLVRRMRPVAIRV